MSDSVPPTDSVNGLVIGSDLSRHYRKAVFIKGFIAKFPSVIVDVESEKNWWRFFYYLWVDGRKKKFILVMQPAQYFIFPLLVYRFFFKKLIIIDAHISIYDTLIGDRQLVNKFSLKAAYYYTLDFLSCWLADILIFDTALHRDYFVKTFHIRRGNKKIVIPVCIDMDFVDEQLAHKTNTKILPNVKFNILFFGLYIPLQGVEFIIEAASLLQLDNRFHFTLIGAGQTKSQIISKAKELNLTNVSFINRISYKELFPYILDADVCLGIFGVTDKAKRVIPNKLLESMACGKITITGYNPEIGAAFRDGEEVILCQMGNGIDLAAKIKQVADNPEAFSDLGIRAQNKIRQLCSLESLGKYYLNEIEQYIIQVK